MKRHLISILTLAAAIFATDSAANAATQAYVSNTGGGSACSYAAPCGEMSPAVTAAGVGGEVICLNKGYYGSVLITYSITISCGDLLWEAPATRILIKTPAGSVVTIEGLVFNSSGTSTTSTAFIGQGALELRRVRIDGVSSPGVSGLSFAPNGPSALIVKDSAFTHNNSAGIEIIPVGSAVVRAAIENTAFTANKIGVRFAGKGTVSIRNSMVTNNVIGVFAAGAVDFSHSLATGNNTAISASGAAGVVSLAESRIYGNLTGLQNAGGGSILSFGNNEINGNTTNGAPTGPVPLK